MRTELTDIGASAAPSPTDETLKSPGVVMMVVNFVCGCAAGKARPGIAALQHANRPDVVATVFAGADIDATDCARGYFTGFALVALDRIAARRQAASWSSAGTSRAAAQAIADLLTMAFDVLRLRPVGALERTRAGGCRRRNCQIAAEPPLPFGAGR
jgi:hypothetical protein